MRVMVMVKATKNSEANVMPSKELLEAMNRYNEELVKAGILVDGGGLHPSSRGKRWALRCPAPMPGEEGELEIRPFLEPEDFGEAYTPELRESEERMRAEVERRRTS